MREPTPAHAFRPNLSLLQPVIAATGPCSQPDFAETGLSATLSLSYFGSATLPLRAIKVVVM